MFEWLNGNGHRASIQTAQTQSRSTGYNGKTASNSHHEGTGAGSPGQAFDHAGLDGTAWPLSEPMIDLRGITKAYNTDAGPFLALKGIDLRIMPGEFVAVVGRSGSGKSTLINMFTGIDHPTDGEVVVSGTRIRQLDEGQMAEWRGRHLGIVFQFFQLLPTLTVVENVMLPMDLCGIFDPAERYDRAVHLLDQVGVAEDALKFPAAVSGGQQQRAAIARALANDPPILVADEPTGNLDSRAAGDVYRLFESLVSEGKTILMVTHDRELAAQAPRALTLADGEFVREELRPTLFVDQPAVTLAQDSRAIIAAQHAIASPN